MKKRYRIKKNSEIDAIYQKKKVAHSQHFGLYHDVDPKAQHFRFAISIGKKYGNAVERNLLKRRVRMIIHDFKIHIHPQALVLLVVRPQAKRLSFQAMKDEISLLLHKLKLMELNYEQTL
ncbi:MAG: ribonuclease P protein component [Acholeplasmataceae bacterium]|nr:ribonuclease P protein component [Acholeplasmataceae bacterium]